jgi:hypothetical protein
VKKTRQNKRPEVGSDFIRTGLDRMIRKSGYRFSGKVMLGPPELQGTA